MLQRVTSPNGVVYYRSPVLERAGVPHGFSTRMGGVSPPPFDSLNLGNPNGAAVQDDVARIQQNYHLLAEATGLAQRRLCRAHQVHGCGLVDVSSAVSFDNSEKADALVTSDPAAMLTVRVADCVPVLLATADGKVVAAVHAGWRGVIANAAGVAVAAMRKRAGRDDVRILAAVGPSISTAAFEVGPEVAAEFTTAFGAAAPVVFPPGATKPHVDLRTALWLQLIGLGVEETDIDTNDRCTVRDADEFFSHRRENGVTGRMAAVIGVR